MEAIPSRYGTLIASRNDVYIGKGLLAYGEFSEGEVELFRQLIRPEHVVCDIGANIGAHTLAFARIAKHVHAFEPQPLLFNALCGMVALNELRNVSCYHAGCYSREGTMDCADLDFSRENNLGAAPLEPFTGKRPVRVTRLVTPCDFLKIDVEGMELDVLRGAAEMIREKRPTIYLEADRPDKLPALWAYLRQLGYFPYWHTPPLFNPDNYAGRKDDIWGGVYSINAICFPKEQPDCGLPRADLTPLKLEPKDWVAA